MSFSKYTDYVKTRIASLPPYMTYLKQLYDKDMYTVITSIKKPFKVGTDCSGIDAPINALRVMNIPYQYEFASDIDLNAKESIMCNDSPKQFFDDITTRDHRKLPKIDMYFAGFPCQSFSTLGKREGFSDEKERGIIFFHCYKTIESTQPSIFILENVKGLTNHDGGRTFKTIMDQLHQLKGYDINYQIYNTENYGVPQSRDRIYIIGIKGSHKKFVHPHPVDLKITVRDVLETNVTDQYYYELTEHKEQILLDLVNNGVIDSLDNDWLVNLNVSSYKRSGAKQDIVPCLLAGEGGNCTYYLTSEQRRLTNIEYLRLQGFPPDFKICVSRSKTYKQVGNTMSVNVLCFIIKNALIALM